MSEQTTHRIINGDCRNMSSVADKSAQLIITSPPYWQLKDYGVSNQIGFDDDYEAYINNLNVVWKECFRVLDDGCRLCINVGDQFARSVYYGRYKVIPIHSEIIRFCETIGFDFMGQIIWQKSTTMNTTGGGAVMGSFPFPRNGIVKLDFEYILLFKKQGKSKKPTAEQKELSKMTNEEWNTYFAGHWHFAGSKQDKHLAMFPDELPRRLIKMFSFVGETVLDPFAGSGTTAKVARELGRNSVNFEINSDFMALIQNKLGQDDFFSSISFETDKTAISKLEIKRKVLSLPYQFEDVHKLDKTANIKSLQYGSKIDIGGSKKREELYSVREVISPEVVELNTGTTVRLIGIKRDIEKVDKAVDFMHKKFKGRKVFLKSDTVQYGDCHTPAYLYLDNKTFINAHLLKYGYAYVDDSVPFSLMNKFITLRSEAVGG